jgi:signal recognition particle GTPase
MQPEIIEGNRKNRIASGSGTNVLDVSQLLKQFKQMKKMFKHFGGDGGSLMPSEGMLPHDAMKMNRKLRSKRKKLKRKKR